MAITLTKAAAQRVKHYLQSQEEVQGLRVAVKTTGCSGYAYVLDYFKQPDDGDKVFESEGVKLAIDEKSLGLVDGTEIDFTEDGLATAFKFKNPNVTAECGCGESFTIG